MTTINTPPETMSKFTPEQQLRLGQVYAMILLWNREDDQRLVQKAGQSLPAIGAYQDSVNLAEIARQEG